MHSIVKFYREIGKDLCPSLILLRIENIGGRNRKDGRRKLISVFNNPHRKGLFFPPVMASWGEYNFGFKFNRSVKIQFYIYPLNGYRELDSYEEPCITLVANLLLPSLENISFSLRLFFFRACVVLASCQGLLGISTLFELILFILFF